MSDTIVGIIIGGAIVLISTVIGAVVQGLISKRITKLQIEASRHQQDQQLNFQKQESQIIRLIELRATYLNPLKKHIQQLVQSSIQARKKLRGTEAQYPSSKPGKYTWLKALIKHETLPEMVDELVKRIQRIPSTKIETLMAQVNDDSLSELILEMLLESSHLSADILHIRNQLVPWTQKPKQPVTGIDYTLIETHLEKLQKYAHDANKRIEALLSGE